MNPNAELETTLNLTPRFVVVFNAYYLTNHAPHHLDPDDASPIFTEDYESALWVGRKRLDFLTQRLPLGVRPFFSISKTYEVI